MQQINKEKIIPSVELDSAHGDTVLFLSNTELYCLKLNRNLELFSC